jgi:hypothetical protein
MPYHLLRSEGKKPGWFVVNSDTGEKKNKEPKSHEEALAFLRALYVNVPDAKKDAKS